MFKTSFLFELTYRLKSLGTWICFLGLFFLSYREMLAGDWDLLIQSGRVARNSPYTVYYLFMFYTFWAVTIGCAMMIPTLLRDLKSGTAELLYSFPINSKQYFLGKYCASLVIFVLLMSSVAFGFITMPFVATTLGTHPPSDFVATPWAHIAHAFLLWVLPACFIYGSLTFSLTALTGRAGPVYALMMLAVGAFVIITALYGDGAPKSSLVQVLDPLGKVTVEGQIYYWTAEERMHKFLAFEGPLLQNRLLYMGIAALVLLFAWAKFDVRQLLQRAKNREAVKTLRKELFANDETNTDIPNNEPAQQDNVGSDVFHNVPSYTYWFGYAVNSGWRLFTVVLANKAFYISMLTLILMLVLAGFSYESVDFEGSGKVLPKAFLLLPSLIYPSLIFTLVAATFFSIEVCDTDRTFRIEQLVESCPVPTWAIMLSKVMSVTLMSFILALIPVVSVLLIQYGQGFFDTNWAMLTHVTLLVLLPLTLAYGLISIICYALLSNKVLAQVFAVIICITPAIFNEVKTVENFMYLWAWPFFVQLSDFNASGQYLQRNLSFAAYWLSLYAFLLVVVYWFWPRGANATLMARWTEARHRLKPVSIVMASFFCAVFVWSTINIHSGMIVDNDFHTSVQKHAIQADYEKRFGATRHAAQPKIIDANLDVALYPQQRRADYSGVFILQNKHKKTIHELVLNYAEFSSITSLKYNQTILQPQDIDLTHRRLRYSLPYPMEPGDNISLDISLEVAYRGFSNDEFDYHGTIVADGSYFDSGFWPTLGYDNKRELKLSGLRQDHNLGQSVSTPYLSQAQDVSDLVTSDDADFMTSRIRISTALGQVALASGNIVEQQQKSDRSIVIFENNLATPWDLHMVSAHYELTKETWRPESADTPIIIEIYHHPKHGHNIPRIIEAAKQALARGHRQWGLFPYQQLRIAEVPNGMTQSHVNGNLLVIPENHVWSHDYRKEPDIDWITFHIARDVSRMWWQQLPVADVRGHQLLSEAVPILQGLQAIESKLGEASVSKFVDQISDSYLRQRTSEDKLEAVVVDLDQQEYAANKATLALYSSYQILGLADFNSQLSVFFSSHRKNETNSYANAGELVKQLVNAGSTPELKNTLYKLFNETHYYDFKVDSVEVTNNEGKGYQLQAVLSATEFIYQNGKNTEIGYHGFARVKVLAEVGEKGKGEGILYDKEIRFEQGQANLQLDFLEKPSLLLVNPRRRLLERSAKDNSFSF